MAERRCRRGSAAVSLPLLLSMLLLARTADATRRLSQQQSQQQRRAPLKELHIAHTNGAHFVFF